MAITDLTGTKWVLNSTLDMSSFYSSNPFNLQFNGSFYCLQIVADYLSGDSLYYSTLFNPTPDSHSTLVYSSNDGWSSQSYRTIEITGGTDASNATLITWLENNATQVGPEPLPIRSISLENLNTFKEELELEMALPTTTVAGKVLKSTTTAGTVHWGDDADTNYYHSTGTWNDLTYTATANGGTSCPELKFTIPTGTTATTVCAGNDSRLSDARTPTSHTHGNITNTGTITSTAVTSATGVLVYDSSNKIQRATAANARSIISAASSGHTHGNITNTGAITSTTVTSATGVVVYDSNNKIQRATASNARTIIGAASTDDLATIVDLTSSNSSTASSIPLLLSVYPVGAIYISTNSTSPASLFGGTWEKLANRFLFAAGSGYNAGATGGEFTHTLTAAEMPVHSHNYIRYGSMTNYSHAGSSGYVNWDSAPYSTYDSGGDQPHNNMPPYLVVHMWKRVS